MKKKKVSFFIVITICIISITLSFSYSWFKKVLDTKTSVNIAVSTITYNLTGEQIKNNQLVIPENDDILISLDIKNEHPIDTKYRIYYNFITELEEEEKNNFEVLNYNDSTKFAQDTINKNSTNTIKLVISNQLHKDITIEFGVIGGLIANPLETDKGISITKNTADTTKLKIKQIVDASEDYFKKSGMSTSTTLSLPKDNDKISLPNNELSGTVYIKNDGRAAFQGVNEEFCMFKRFDFENAEIVNNNNDICTKPLYKNLVENGYGEYESNVHFPTFVYDETTKDFYHTMKSTEEWSTFNKYIKVDTTKKYNQKIDMYANENNSLFYVGFRSYDIDYKEISDRRVMYIENTLTTLARDLNDGDTVVYLTDTSNWLVPSEAYQKGFIFWNYQDSTGYLYPPETYSQNIFLEKFEDDGIDKVTHQITLKKPWNFGTFPAGTKLSQINSGASYNYSLLTNKPLKNTYTTYSATIEGITYNNKNPRAFRPATKYISPFLILNSDNLASAENKLVYFKNLIFEEIESE